MISSASCLAASLALLLTPKVTVLSAWPSRPVSSLSVVKRQHPTSVPPRLFWPMLQQHTPCTTVLRAFAASVNLFMRALVVLPAPPLSLVLSPNMNLDFSTLSPSPLTRPKTLLRPPFARVSTSRTLAPTRLALTSMNSSARRTPVPSLLQWLRLLAPAMRTAKRQRLPFLTSLTQANSPSRLHVPPNLWNTPCSTATTPRPSFFAT
mmetsp:Transcript_10474/g.20639  ORF Transcript_10474/g.20639 Transcript_10474/m.20639 type:complete len:207 (+) Transcript_10474:1018-1638(+)